MKVLENDETSTRAHAFAAAVDARNQHRTHWPSFTKVKQDIASDLKVLCQAAYFGSKVYMNARDKFIAVKVDKPKASTAWLYATELAALNTYATKVGIEPVNTINSLIFRVMK
jgi:hypothetical protein